MQEDDGPAVHAYIRERGVGSLLGLVEQQCEGVLREESRVIRRGTAGADELVHLCESSCDRFLIMTPVSAPTRYAWASS